MNEAELTDNEEEQEERISVNQARNVEMRNSFKPTGNVVTNSDRINIEQDKYAEVATLNQKGANNDEEISSFWGRSQNNR